MLSAIQADLFAALNSVVEPRVRQGWGSPWLLRPAGLIVVETLTRHTGRHLRVPLAALRIGDSVVVSTVRGGRSQWLRNLAANPEIRYWMGGRPRQARAVVLPAGAGKASSLPLSGAMKTLAAALTPYRRAGCAFAVLIPV